MRELLYFSYRCRHETFKTTRLEDVLLRVIQYVSFALPDLILSLRPRASHSSRFGP
jgi:hypothetical protein